jgi:hypothetical protein
MNRSGIARENRLRSLLRRMAREVARAWAEPVPPLGTMLAGVVEAYARPRAGLWAPELMRTDAQARRRHGPR